MTIAILEEKAYTYLPRFELHADLMLRRDNNTRWAINPYFVGRDPASGEHVDQRDQLTTVGLDLVNALEKVPGLGGVRVAPYSFEFEVGLAFELRPVFLRVFESLARVCGDDLDLKFRNKVTKKIEDMLFASQTPDFDALLTA